MTTKKKTKRASQKPKAPDYTPIPPYETELEGRSHLVTDTLFEPSKKEKQKVFAKTQEEAVEKLQAALYRAGAKIALSPTDLGSVKATPLLKWLGDGVEVWGRQVGLMIADILRDNLSVPEPPEPLHRNSWDTPLGPITGKKGEVKEIVVEPEHPLMVQKVMATDSGPKESGYNTKIDQVIIGGRLQTPGVGSGTLAVFFRHDALGNGVKWSWCKAGQKIRIMVRFLEDAEFHGVLWGETVRKVDDKDDEPW